MNHKAAAETNQLFKDLKTGNIFRIQKVISATANHVGKSLVCKSVNKDQHPQFSDGFFDKLIADGEIIML